MLSDPGFDQDRVLQSARTCFQKFICHIPSTFSSSLGDVTSGLRERNSTVRLLGFGLNRALAQGVAHDSARPSSLEGSLSLTDSLQQQILEFTKRLHTAEVERRDLRMQVRATSQLLCTSYDNIHKLIIIQIVLVEALEAAKTTTRKRINSEGRN